MQSVDRLYVAIGFLWLVGAAVFGTWLGASGHFGYAESHAHIGLVGFVASMLFGLVHRGWPDLRRSRLALPQLVVYEVGAVVLLAGKIMVDATGQPNMLLMTGAPIVIVGSLMFLWLFVRKPAEAADPQAVPAE